MNADASPTTPEAWSNLISAIQLLAKHPTNTTSPVWCQHDILHICADDTQFTPEQIAQLDDWGFHVDENEGGFYSFT